DGDAHALRVRPLGQVVETFRRQRAPPAAVNENGKWRRSGVAFGGKEVDGLPRRWAVGKIEFGAARLLAIGLAVAQPVDKNLHVLRHAGTIIVFFLVIDRHFTSPGDGARMRQAGQGNKTTTAREAAMGGE